MLELPLIGIDYGSKLSGNTVIAYVSQGRLCVEQVAPKKDADQFLIKWIETHRPGKVFIDAPLSLPGVFTKPEKYTDYFYRRADRELKAMSPMFLGGLTARAMKLQSQWSALPIDFVETYPGYLARKILFPEEKSYKKERDKIPAFVQKLALLLPFPLARPQIPNWHQVDALLAFFSAWRAQEGKAQCFGDPEEGLIVV